MIALNMKFDYEKNYPIIKKLAEKHGLVLVALFGSVAKGKTHKQSDVDLAILAERRLRPMELAEMQFDFSQNLGVKNLELADMKSASPLLLKQVAQNAKLLYEKEPSAFARFKIYGYKSYMEAKSLLSLRKLQLDKFLS
ncbi:MAG: hypothetical protein AUK20_01645 [Parcubacteria group bacterium CG2_30_45_37]|nr:MAG: hypothetical protein AUK20_01645 [Parcubacteria group bacterium CG2_30_45_37]